MATIKPFCAVRPRQDIAARVAALPYDVYNRAEAKIETKREPLSFLCIDRAETQLGDDIDTYDPQVYKKAASLMKKRIDDNTFVQDATPCYYVYELTMDGRSQTGVVGVASIDDYISGRIKKHENTRADKEVDRINHVDALSAQTGPIFLAYRGRDDIRQVLDSVKKTQALYDFTSPDGITHRVWAMREDKDIFAIQSAFEDTDSVYIADGHHRSAAAALVGAEKQKQNPNHNGTEEYNVFMAVCFQASQLTILDYNRVVKDLNGMSSEEFLAALQVNFIVEDKGTEIYKPQQLHEFSLYLDEHWFSLKAKEGTYDNNDPIGVLDVDISSRLILDEILNIGDLRSSQRIDFVGGLRGLKELKRRVDSGEMRAALALYPVSMQQIMDIADSGKIMPPKATWFEPKLRSGLVIHKLV